MWGWLKRLRAKKKTGEESPDDSLEILRDGKSVTCSVMAARGMSLLCSLETNDNGHVYFLVSEGQCIRPDDFCKIWRRKSADFVWESGEPLNGPA
jgi:hypothetical protein